MVSAQEALTRLKAGNSHFVEVLQNRALAIDPMSRFVLAKEHKPFAIILGCSDARVPAELIFNQGLGDLFVIRVAGNIVAPSQIGSVEFAVEQFGVRLVVVLGHTKCGAIAATLQEIQNEELEFSKNVMSIVNRIRPGISPIVQANPTLSEEELSRLAVRANVSASVNQLRHGSPILEDMIAKDGLEIVGAEYAIDTGVVEYLKV